MAVLLITGSALAAIAVVLGLTRPETALAASFGLTDVLEVGGFLMFVALGGLMLLRRPGHPIGWLSALLGVMLLVDGAGREYALTALTPTPLPLWTAAAWISAWAFAPALTAFVEILLLFPSGRPSSRRGAWLALTVALLGTALTIGWAAASWPLRNDPESSIDVPVRGWSSVLPRLTTVLVICLILAAGSLMLRYRRAEAVERLQLKWLAVAALGLVVAALVGVAVQLTGGESVLVVELIGTISIAGIPIAITVAILRYRLYEIDRILSRTVTYTLLTGLLAGVYSGGILLVSALSAPLSADSDVAVAASTLAVAGLFGPLRRRLQAAVDRRFNRSAYDAARVVAAFRARLQNEVELDALIAGLLHAARRTVEPQLAAVWLRPPASALPDNARLANTKGIAP
ncbi:MAG: hypothetical protein ACR2MA_12550 [Egibacteraceae bacterium]